jgi:hypothetical protein
MVAKTIDLDGMLTRLAAEAVKAAGERRADGTVGGTAAGAARAGEAEDQEHRRASAP